MKPFSPALAVPLALLCLAGCRRPERVSLPNRITPLPAYVPHEGSGNGFDGLALAALKAEADAPTQLSRVFFTPGQRRSALSQSAAATAIARRAVGSGKLEFEFRPTAPGAVAPYHAGWRLIGRHMVWTIEDAVIAEDYERAVAEALTATRFGFALSGGGPIDASLGLTIADEARRALTPALPHLESQQLERLESGLTSALSAKPLLTVVVDHETQNMALAIQTVQDAFSGGNLNFLENELGKDARETIGDLEAMRGKDAEKARNYFDTLAAEADEEAKYLRQIVLMPANKRPKPPELKGKRPWKHLARHYLRGMRPLLGVNDATLARTRLLALTADLMRRERLHLGLPASLDGFDTLLRTDPFTGSSLLYRRQGAEFSIYSAGSNFEDDGGDTDESFTQPDLCLESNL